MEQAERWAMVQRLVPPKLRVLKVDPSAYAPRHLKDASGMQHSTPGASTFSFVRGGKAQLGFSGMFCSHRDARGNGRWTGRGLL